MTEEEILHHLAIVAARAHGVREEDLEYASTTEGYVTSAKCFRAMWNQLWYMDPPVKMEQSAT